MKNYYLYKGKIYHCSEATTEAELYGADCSYGYGDCLFFLDELGNYVKANDCLQVSPNFFTHLKFWLFENVYLKLIGVKNKIQIIGTENDKIPFEFDEF